MFQRGENAAQPWLRQITRLSAWPVLGAVFMDLAFIRGGAYLPSGIHGLHLPDLLFFLGALAGVVLAIVGRYAQPRGIWVLTAATGCYVIAQLVLARVADASLSAAVRDLAPFLYLLALPGLTYLLSQVSGRRIVLVLRAATLTLATWLAISFLGIDLARLGEGISQHLFSLNADVAGVVLAVGAVAWGRQGALRPYPAVQILMGVLGMLLHSRVAAVVMVGAGLVVLVSQADARARIRALAGMIGAALLSVVLGAAIPGQAENHWIDGPLPGLTRAVLPSERTATGTTLARFDTWGDALAFIAQWPRPLFGGGVGSDALAAACNGACAVAGAVVDLRYPHNIELSIVLYQGLMGLLLFMSWLVAIGSLAYRRRPTALQWFGLGSFLFAAQFGVVLESPFGLVPWVFFAAWALGRPGRVEPELRARVATA